MFAFYLFMIAGFIDTLYTWSAFNTEEIGNIIANSLEILIKTYPISNIHLIGHSLGAHSKQAFTNTSNFLINLNNFNEIKSIIMFLVID